MAMKNKYALLCQFVEIFSFAEHSSDKIEKPLVSHETAPAMLADIYDKLPARFPQLYEQLILSYRWGQQAFIPVCRLLPNPPGPTLSGLLNEMMTDQVIFDVCTRNGFIPFAFGSDLSHDPVCFDTNSGARRNFKIVRLEHEPILRQKIISNPVVISKSFEELVLATLSN
jgi:hypothetical protein